MRSESQSFVSEVISDLDYGDQIVLLQMQQESLKDHPRRLSVEMPTIKDPSFESSRDKEALRASRSEISDLLPVLFKPKDGEKIVHTDIFATLNRAAEYKRDSKASGSMILILSDMLQSGSGFEMEHLRKMPSQKWISTELESKRMPQFPGACIAVIGADTSTKEGAEVRRFWQNYFRAAQASLSYADYRSTPPDSIHDLCK